MTQMQYPSYNQMTMANYSPCANCLYRGYNHDINYGYNYNYPYRGNYNYNNFNYNNISYVYPEMKPVPMEEIID
jgi:hypothetical protein